MPEMKLFDYGIEVLCKVYTGLATGDTIKHSRFRILFFQKF